MTVQPASRPWQPITVDVPGTVFEPRPPDGHAFDAPDTACDGWSTPQLTVRWASVRGARHRYYGEPRQDAARAAAHGTDGSVVLAVADGVSSAAHADLGAVEVCRAAVEWLLHQGTAEAAARGADGLTGHAAARLHELGRWLCQAEPGTDEVAALVATTLVAGTVRPEPGSGRANVELCRVGDSGAWLLDRSRRSYRPLFTAKTGADGGVVATAVTPLPPAPAAPEQVRVALGPHEVLLVGTDGFGDPLGDGDGLVGALFADLLAEPPPPAWFAHVLDFSRETFDDDRTLLAVWLRDPHGGR